MSDVHPPPWIGQDDQPLPPKDVSVRSAGNPAWYPGMKSPNPSGRPKGSNSQTKLMERILADADGVVDAVVAKALEGDTGAASLVLSRIIPALKAQSEKVQFDFDAAAPADQQVEAVLAAITSGIVSPDVGKQIIDAVASLAQVRATEQLEARIAALEEARVR